MKTGSRKWLPGLVQNLWVSSRHSRGHISAAMTASTATYPEPAPEPDYV